MYGLVISIPVVIIAGPCWEGFKKIEHTIPLEKLKPKKKLPGVFGKLLAFAAAI